MARVITGTGDVGTGDAVVAAWAGQPLTEINCPPGSPVVVEGYANFVKERISTLSFEMELPHAGAGGTGLAIGVSAMTPLELSVGTLNGRTANVIQQLNMFDKNVRGLFYDLIGVTGDNDPGPGQLALNDADPTAVDEIYLDVLDANDGGRDVSGLIELWRPATVLVIRSLNSTSYLALQLISAPTTVGGTYYRVNVEYVGHSGSLASEPVSIEWSIVGEGIQIDYSGTYAQRTSYDLAPVDKIFASINGANGAGPPTVLYRKQSATSGDWSAPIPFQGPESKPRVAVTVWDPGKPGASELIWKGIFDVPVSFPINLAGVNATSQATAGAAATAVAVYSIRKNGVQFATLTFGVGGTVGIFAGTAADFAAGDTLSVLAPNPRDTTLAQVAITLAGTR